MFRQISIILILNITMTFLPKMIMAQISDEDCEKIKKDITGLNDEMTKLSAQMQSQKILLDEVNEHIQKTQADLKAYEEKVKNSLNPLLQINEEIRAKFLDALSKMMDVRKGLKKEIEDGLLTMQALKDVIADLLNQLANCGNKEKKTAMKEKTSSHNLFLTNSGNFELCAGAGYGFSFNGGLLGQNKTFTANDRTFDGQYGSWAQGTNIFIKTDFHISNSIGVGVVFDYSDGKNYTWDVNAIGVNPTYQHYESQYTGYSATPFIQFNPCGSNLISPYVDLGLRLNFSNTIKQTLDQTQTSNNITTTTIQEATLKGAFSTGFDAALGIKFRLSNNWGLNAEINSSNSNFVQDHATINKYMINGTDQLGTLNVSQKQTDYVKSYTVPNSGFDSNSPSKALKNPVPASTIGISLGISCTPFKARSKVKFRSN